VRVCETVLALSAGCGFRKETIVGMRRNG